jgi:ribosomal protein S18 acetylase RimI-like enzyme
MRLFEFARQAGYRRVCLQTSLQQQRAIAFYKRIGFVEVPPYNELPYDDDISLEINLNP